MSTRKIVFLSIMISISIVLSIVESSISMLLFPIPGMKLGLANIATLVVVYAIDRKSGMIVALTRIFLVGLIYSGLFTPSFWISISGGTLAIITILSLKGTKLTIYTVSVLAALFHMIGQVIAAIIVVNTTSLFYLLPYMILLSIPAGMITGYLSNRLLQTFKLQLDHIKK